MPNVDYLEAFDIFTLDDDFFGDLQAPLIMGNSVTLSFTDTVATFIISGSDFDIVLIDEDVEVNGGIVETVEFRLDGMNTTLLVSKLNIPLEDLAKIIEKGDVEKFFREIFDGDLTITGSTGSDGIVGLKGNDDITPDLGNDVVEAGGGTDTAIFAGIQMDYNVSVDKKMTTVTDLNNGDGDEGTNIFFDIEFVQFADVLYNIKDEVSYPLGTNLADILNGSDEDDIINGLGGSDTINGGLGKDTLLGGSGNDILNGGGDKDDLQGGTGNDTYVVGKGDKITEGFNEGIDTVESAEKIKLEDNVENAELTGAEGNSVKGNDLDNFITGNAGENKIDGAGGNDTIMAGAGDDTAKGGDGDDFVFGEAGDDKLDGGDGNDELDGGEGDDDIKAGDGDDYVDAWVGDDKADGGDGNDELLGYDGNDELDGGKGDDSLFGEDDNDILDGGDGNDFLSGDAGNDELDGGKGEDELDGGLGTDVMTGGKDADTFFFDAIDAADQDTITDFEIGLDKIDLADSGFLNFNQVLAASAQVDKDVVITAANNATLALQDVDLDDLSAADFVFPLILI